MPKITHDITFTTEEVSFIEDMTVTDEEKRRLMDTRLSPDGIHTPMEAYPQEFTINSVKRLKRDYCTYCNKVRSLLKNIYRSLKIRGAS